MTHKHRRPRKIQLAPTHARKKIAFHFLHHTGEAVTVLSAGDFFAGLNTFRWPLWIAAVALLATCALSVFWVED